MAQVPCRTSQCKYFGTSAHAGLCTNCWKKAVEAGYSNGLTALASGDVEGLLQSLRTADEKALSAIARGGMDKGGRTALHMAAYGSDVDIVKALCAVKAQLDAKDSYGDTPLALACSVEGAEEVVRVLLRSGARCVGRGNLALIQPLHYAAQLGSVGMCAALLESKARLEITDVDGETALHWASGAGKVTTVAHLLGAGANPHIPAANGYTPVHVAASKNLVETVALLLGTDSSSVDTLTGASESGPPDSRSSMGGLKLTPDGVGPLGGLSPLHVAADCGHVGVIRVLIHAGYDVKKRGGKYREVPLHGAAHRGRLDAVKLLIQLGSGVSTGDSRGFTPLHWSVRKGHANVTRELLRAGASLSKPDLRGNSSLHVGASWVTYNEMKLLAAAAGASSLRARNDRRRTPTDIAEYVSRHRDSDIKIINMLKLAAPKGAPSLQWLSCRALVIAIELGYVEKQRVIQKAVLQQVEKWPFPESSTK